MPNAPKIPHYIRDLNDWSGIDDGQLLIRRGTSVEGLDGLVGAGVQVELDTNSSLYIGPAASVAIDHSIILLTDGTGPSRTLNIGTGGTLGTGAFAPVAVVNPVLLVSTFF